MLSGTCGVVVVCGTITLENKDKSPISRYSDIVDNGVYVTEWSSDGIIPISRISGIELKQLVNRSFDSIRQEMDQYFAKKNLSINFLTVIDPSLVSIIQGMIASAVINEIIVVLLAKFALQKAHEILGSKEVASIGKQELNLHVS